MSSSIYLQTIGEDESGGLLSRRTNQFGMQFALDSDFYTGIALVEFDDTRIGSH